jgi:hypothetical protein
MFFFKYNDELFLLPLLLSWLLERYREYFNEQSMHTYNDPICPDKTSKGKTLL